METVAREGPQALILAEQVLLFMVFALGALIKNDGKSETFYKQASTAAFEVLSETSTESATCAFLLGLYQQTTGRISAAWSMLGAVVRIAQALGCNSPSCYSLNLARRIASFLCPFIFRSLHYDFFLL
jgi:hypothetical protein